MGGHGEPTLTEVADGVWARQSAPGVPPELIAVLTPLPADGGPVPGEVIGHQAHAIGHAAILLAGLDAYVGERPAR